MPTMLTFEKSLLCILKNVVGFNWQFSFVVNILFLTPEIVAVSFQLLNSDSLIDFLSNQTNVKSIRRQLCRTCVLQKEFILVLYVVTIHTRFALHFELGSNDFVECQFSLESMSRSAVCHIFFYLDLQPNPGNFSVNFMYINIY